MCKLCFSLLFNQTKFILTAISFSFGFSVAVYLVVSFTLHNVKVRDAWELKEKELNGLIADNQALKSQLLDETWIEETEKSIRSSKPGQKVLLSELETKLAAFPVKAMPAVDATTPEKIGNITQSQEAVSSVDQEKQSTASSNGKEAGVVVKSSQGSSARVI
jgi:hypothetical protein